MNSVRPDNQLPRAGDIVAGKYRVESIIGQGGMGVVLGATDTSLGRRVAIKFLAPHKARNEGTAARFVREARAAASIQSEHVVRVFEVSTLPNGASYIVMEHLAGGDLAQILAQRGPLPIEEAADYLLQACEAIAEAHGRGIVHRDLKPQNLFVTHLNDGTPTVKVLDFGISKAIDDDAPNLTATDTVMGTPLYMSPEQVRSLKNVDLRSDIWALGAILFELVTAAPIYEAATATALCAMIAMDPPTPLRAKRPSAPAELEALILRCLHKDPNGRFQDVGQFAEALAGYATERGRLSASRIVRMVRGNQPGGAAMGAAAAMGASGMGAVNPYAPTGGSMTGGSMTGGGMAGHNPSHIPPATGSSPSLGGYGGAASNYPPGAFAPGHAYPMGSRTTQETWQNQTGAMGTGTIEQRRSGSMLFALLGVVAGIFVLVLIAGAGLYVYSQRADTAKAQADAGAAAADPPAAAGIAAPVASGSPTVAAASTAPVAGTTAKRVDPKTVAAKDAGVAPVAPVAPAAPGAAPATPGAAPGTPAAPAAPTADEEAQKLARQKQIADGQCGLQRSILSRNKSPANAEATQVKNAVCLQASSLSPNSGAANCHRTICRQACSILNDQACLRNVDFADRSNPLKF